MRRQSSSGDRPFPEYLAVKCYGYDDGLAWRERHPRRGNMAHLPGQEYRAVILIGQHFHPSKPKYYFDLTRSTLSIQR